MSEDTSTDTREELVGPARSHLDVLLANYRESRKEGLDLVHSFFRDIPIVFGLVTAVASGGFLDKPRLLLILPVLLEGLVIYELAKFHANNLVTSYMIYLERRINRLTGKRLMIWNDLIISRHLSAGRGQSGGDLALVGAEIALLALIGGSVTWAYSTNLDLFRSTLYLSIWGSLVGFLFLVCIFQLYGTLRSIQKLGPDKIAAFLEKDGVHATGS